MARALSAGDPSAARIVRQSLGDKLADVLPRR